MARDRRDEGRERDFDALLEAGAAGLPGADIAAEVTPWRRAMNRVVAGLGLTLITLNFWHLDDILPVAGTVLLLLGLRSLRRENRWFGACFLLALARGACFFPLVVLNTTILQSTFYASPTGEALGIFSTALQGGLIFCFWQALRAVRRKAGLPTRVRGGGALLVWYALVALLALMEYTGLLGWGVLIAYVLILRSLWRLAGAMEEAGYAIRPAPVRLSDRTAALVLAAVLLIGCACGYCFGGSYPMDWQPLDPEEHRGLEETKDRLLALGFPGDVLDDLTPEDIEACAGALRVEAEVTEEAANDGREESIILYRGGTSHTTSRTVYDTKELRVTAVGVALPGGRWRVFHHFLWLNNPGFYGTESIQIWPTYQDRLEHWTPDGAMTGRLLYDRAGEQFTADYYFLGEQTFTAESVFFGQETRTDLFAAFSLPRQGERCRGYVSYPVVCFEEHALLSSWMNYTHQTTWLQYPAETAMGTRMGGSWNRTGAFLTVQTALQFYPIEGIEN